MSADNGIYILETYGRDGVKEYRVKHLQAIENLQYDEYAPDPQAIRPSYDGEYVTVNEYWHPNWKWHEQHTKYQEAYKKKYHSDDRDVMIRNARRMWKGCKVFTKLEDALREAYKQYDGIMDDEMCPIVEYGIQRICIDRKF